MYGASAERVKFQRCSDETPKKLEKKRSTKRKGLRPVSSDLTSGLLYKSYVDNLISNSKYDRAKQLGISPKQELSFEVNQSFPKPSSSHKMRLLPHQCSDPGHPDESTTEKGLADFKGIEPNSVNYTSFQVPAIFYEKAASIKGRASSSIFARSWPSSAALLSRGNPVVTTTTESDGGAPSTAPTPPQLQVKRRSLVGNSLLESSDGLGLASTPGNLLPGAKKCRKAILTVDSKTSEILIANDTACKMFSMNYRQLVGRTLTGLLCSTEHREESLENELLLLLERSALVSKDGSFIPNYGKLIDIIDSTGTTIPVSLWLYPLKRDESVTPKTALDMKFAKRKVSDFTGVNSVPLLNNSWGGSDSAARLKLLLPDGPYGSLYEKTLNQERCLIVLEPVDRMATSCTLGPHGRIFSADAQLADIFGYVNESDILGTSVKDLIPSLELPNCGKTKCARGQLESLTGRTKNGLIFPLQVSVAPSCDDATGDILSYELKMYILTAVSGIVTVMGNGEVHSVNPHFVWALAGKTEREVRGQHVLSLLPDVLSATSEEDKMDTEQMIMELSGLSLSSGQKLKRSNGRVQMGSEGWLSPPELNPQATSTPYTRHTDHGVKKESTPSVSSEKFVSRMAEGTFGGFLKHKDGSLINVGYQVRKLIIRGGKVLFCLWIFYKAEFPEVRGELVQQESTDSESDFDAEVLKERKYSDPNPMETELTRGPYANSYDALVQLGTGAFGSVRLAARKSDELLVITKFIRKEKVLPDSWVLDSDTGKAVPIEICLLTSLRHPNIVEVLEVCENDMYYQMVMKKHGAGMDLFDFIDRSPIMDEPIMSFIFRQIVSAVKYLDGLSIVHRDIKDENVIIGMIHILRQILKHNLSEFLSKKENFKCKLIDFGSAAYYKLDAVFSTFCGTIEYCSPEVLLGNKYVGPELEIWSLGILLYTVVYGENPFCTAQETIQAELNAPWDVSEGLEHLINWCLHPDPGIRATIRDVSSHWWVTQSVDITKYNLKNVLPSSEPHELKPPKYMHELDDIMSEGREEEE